MQKKRLFLVSSVTVMLFISIFLYRYISSITPITDKNDVVSKEVNSMEKLGQSAVPFLVYIPNDKTGLLDPTVVDINSKGDTYRNLIRALIDSSKGYFKGECNLVLSKKSGSILTLKFNDGFKDNLSQDENKYNLEIMSIVSTFSEITGVEYIEIYSGTEKISFKGVNKFLRDPKLINMERFNSPEDVLRKQMKHEQNGEFLKSYLLMSYKHSSNKKMYYDYVKEMEEIKSLGFLSGDFKIRDCNIDKNEATLKVEFINVSKTGEDVNTSVIEVRCIKLNGTWLVNWI